MKKNPPHLPAKACSVPFHRRSEMLFQFGAMIVIAFVSGIAATLVTLAWIIPVYTPNTIIYSIDANSRSERDRAIDPLFVRQQEKQIVNVYDKRKKVANEFFEESAYVGPGVFLTSDGWLVLHMPAYVAGSEKYWEIVDYKGSVYVPEEAVFDPLHDLVYVHINGDGFFAGSFASEADREQQTFSWSVYGGEWRPALLGDRIETESDTIFPIWESRFAKEIEGNVPASSILLAEDGRLVGFVGSNGTVLSSFFVELQYTTVFEDRIVDYRGVDWEGYMVNASLRGGVFKNINGFYIVSAPTRPSETHVGAGDIVMRIEGDVVDEETLAQEIFSAPEEFTVTVLRDSQEIDILITKERIRVQ